ncbi:leucine-rich repeat protein [Hespellia stercorisuis]|uniref:Listeria/Bacterioides repeat-containing protein n=1 Tax=Hespellia stercorisuis DSM 15480 TaxID=1121950 RepID=A0A1M6U722_9FIRM|nr:leucine-rich repeat protein [Hespellia stercorisuis]SHK65075.1 Listeria/Bacterioides repeat-containing protein [Hespellia stercorisuis DSM 15480]
MQKMRRVITLLLSLILVINTPCLALAEDVQQGQIQVLPDETQMEESEEVSESEFDYEDEMTGLSYDILSEAVDEEPGSVILMKAYEQRDESDENYGKFIIPETIEINGVSYQVIEIAEDAFLEIQHPVLYCNAGSIGETYAKNLEYNVNIEGFQLNTLEEKMAEGEMFQLEIIETDILLSDADNILWETADEAVAVVGNDGRVEAVAEGETTITCEIQGLSREVSISVKAKEETEEPDISKETEKEKARKEPGQTTAEPKVPGDASALSSGIFTYTMLENQKVCITGTIYDNEPWDIRKNIFQLSVPETIDGYPVTTIGNGAFTRVSELIKVVLPESIVEIRREAFRGCTKLWDVALPSKLEKLGCSAFESTAITKVTIPAGLQMDEYVGGVAYPGPFRWCSQLKNVEFAAGTTSIERCMFLNCSGLEEIVIPDTVSKIEWNTFGGCSNLKSVTLPASIKAIGNRAFSNCTSLQSVTLPSELEVLDVGAFSNCTSLSTINIPKNIEAGAYVGGNYQYPGPFSGCTSLKTVTFDKGTTRLPVHLFNNCDGLERIEIPAEVKTIPGGLCYGCDNLKEIIIPKSVTRIEYDAFRNCKSLVKVENLGSTTDLGAWAFGGCTNLETIQLPDTLETIGQGALSYTQKMTSITIPDGVTYIGKEAFKEDDALTAMPVMNGVSNIDSYAFYMCDNLSKIIWPPKLKWLGESVFGKCPKLTEITFPKTLKWTDCEMIYACENLKKVSFEKGSQEIYRGMFGGSVGLEEVEIPNTITKIGAWAFRACYNIKEITIPSSVTEIGDHAFYDCTGLTKITVPYQVKYIGDYAFTNCENVTVYGYAGSAIHTYCKENNIKFVSTGAVNKLTLDANGGYFLSNNKKTTKKTKTVYKDKTYGTLATPTRSGYCFSGWYTAKSGGTKITSSTKVTVSKAQTLYARWTKGGYLTYKLNGGKNSSKNPSYYYASKGVTFSSPTRTGYTFKGWYTDSKFKESTRIQSIAKGKSGNKTLYAKWAVNTYTIRYNKNGGSGTMKDTTSCKYNSSAALRSNTFSRTGYTFAGWAKTASGSVAYKNKASVKNLSSKNGAVITLYAQWTQNRYSIRYNKNGGSGTMKDTTSCKYDSSVALRSNTFSRSGYTFAGWAKTASGSVVYKDKASVKNLSSKNGAVVTLYAKWKKNQTISGSSTFTEAVGGSTFSLGASGKGKLTYQSSDEKVVKVSSTGRVTIVGIGNATITIRAASTTTYNAASKKVTVKIIPRNIGTITTSTPNVSGIFTVKYTYAKTSEITGYQIQYGTKSTFSSGTYKYVWTGKNELSKTIDKLLTLDCYVRLRAYKTLADGTKIYGNYSETKKVHVHQTTTVGYESIDASTHWRRNEGICICGKKTSVPAVQETHTFVSGICTKCGYKKENYIAAQFKSSVGNQNVRTIGAKYADSMFAGSAYDSNSDLAKLSMIGATTAYVKDYAESFLKNCGFQGIVTQYSAAAGGSDLSAPTKTDNDHVQITMGWKDMTDSSGNTCRVYAVLVKGTSGNYEWISNFNMGETKGVHQGFQNAADEVTTLTAGYVQKHNTSNGKKVWVTGHSRGAAVANLVAAALNPIYGGTNVFAYTYATPRTTGNPQKGSSYNNIRNYLNPGDFVTEVALEQWGFERHGQDITLDQEVSSTMQENFLNLANSAYGGFDVGGKNSLVNAFADYAPSQEAYNKTKVSEVAVSKEMEQFSYDKPIIKKFDGTKEVTYIKTEVGPILLCKDGLALVLANDPSGLKNTLLYGADNPTSLKIVAKMVIDGKLNNQFAHAHCQEAYISWLEAMYPEN